MELVEVGTAPAQTCGQRRVASRGTSDTPGRGRGRDGDPRCNSRDFLCNNGATPGGQRVRVPYIK